MIGLVYDWLRRHFQVIKRFDEFLIVPNPQKSPFNYHYSYVRVICLKVIESCIPMKKKSLI